MIDCLYESMVRYIGKTVTIFTTSGGLSGSGFTGVLVEVTPKCVKLITAIGAAPACAVGSTCTGGEIGGYGGYGYGGGCGSGCGCGGYGGYSGGYGYGGSGYWLGSVTEIPVCSIASFTHNAI